MQNILFLQKRVGKNGKVFTMYKIRTMYIGAEKDQKKYEKLNEADNPVFKIYDDPRFIGIGKFLAHTGLDELPQIINVLKGEMAFVGPRPLPVNEAKKLKKWQKEREKVLPGIVSPWVINGMHKMSFDSWMKSDLEYIKKKKLFYDLSIIIRSVIFIFRLIINRITDKI